MNILTGFLHFEHVTEPQSGQIKRRCFGRAKKPDEHYEKVKKIFFVQVESREMCRLKANFHKSSRKNRKE